MNQSSPVGGMMDDRSARMDKLTYLFTEGSITEKRELLTNLKSWLVLKNKQIVIEEREN